MKTIHIRDSFKHGWELFKTHKKVLILATLISLVFSSIGGKNGVVMGLLSLIAFVASIIIKIGFTKMVLKIERGEATQLGELFDHVSLFWKYLGSVILLALLVGLGFILLVIPGVYWMLTYMFVPILIIDKNMKIGEAFTQSKEMTEDVKWKLLGFLLMTLLVNMVGVALLGVGLLVSIPVSTLALIRVYQGLLKAPEPVSAAPVL